MSGHHAYSGMERSRAERLGIGETMTTEQVVIKYAKRIEFLPLSKQRQLLRACLSAYAKYTSGKGDTSWDWDELGDNLRNALCEAIGDDQYSLFVGELHEEDELA